MKSKLFFILFIVLSSNSFAQLGSITARKQGTFYLQWGYNRDWFSKSDIHFKGTYPDSPKSPTEARGKEYNFTLLGADAEDRAQFNRIADWDVTIPQFYYRLGYIFHGENINGIEIGFDHVKYVMKSNQTLRVQGQLYDSTTQSVQNVDREMIVTDNFVHFEHTNGANYLMLSFVRGMYLLRTRSEMHTVMCMVKPGAGIVIPRSDVSINGVRKDNEFHIAGYVAGLEVTLRYTIAEHIFLETAGKGCYANYTNVLTTEGNSANHYFTSFEWLFSLGYQFRL
ncbi:membrane protein [soil metagenome]